jgi:two-component system, chemotaxis family, chemotaxis protein CheY
MKDMTMPESGQTIMVVDDDPLIRDVLRRTLEMYGYRVVAEANDGHEAVAKYSAMRPQVTLMDICLPNKNGIEATKDIVSFDENAKVIMCSAIHCSALQQAAAEGGARDFISKPYTINHLRSVISRVLHV